MDCRFRGNDSMVDLGLIDYEDCYRIQKDFVRRRKLGEIGDSVVIAEHNAVFTIGRSGSPDNLLISQNELSALGVKVLNVDRGGDITFHGPGQLVAYPIIDLKPGKKDLHRYLRALEEVVIRFLKDYDIISERLKNKTGVWVSGMKIASVGISASNWVTFHGFSINVNCDLKYFSMINPCGMKDVEMTSLARIKGQDIDMREARAVLLRHCEEIASPSLRSGPQ